MSEKLVITYRRTDGSLACPVPFEEVADKSQGTVAEGEPKLLVSLHLTDGRTVTIPPLEALTSEERQALARPLLQTSAEALASQFRAEFDQLN
ncbi:MAG TPA: hypothetical protein VIH90_08330 [Candidatus Saccharimonadales bacterium]